MTKYFFMPILEEKNLERIISFLKAGKVAVLPSETSYGLSCDATNQTAVDRIFEIKQRDKTKAMLVVVRDVESAKKYLVWNDLLEKIAQKYWPGALTVVGEYQGGDLAKGVVGADNTVAVRVTYSSVLKIIMEKIGRPLVSTSANIAGGKVIFEAAEVQRLFSTEEKKPDIILDYGHLIYHQPTTIVSVVGNELKVLRQGEVVVSL